MVLCMPQAASLSKQSFLVTAAAYEALVSHLNRLKDERGEGDTDARGTAGPGADVTDQVVLLETALERAVVAYPGRAGYTLAAVGTIVGVDDGRRRCTYRLTFEVDATDDRADRQVSAFSPVGAALMGRAVDETIDISLPGGRFRSLHVLSIRDGA